MGHLGKTASWILLACTAGLALVGCGGGGGDDSDSQPAIRFAAEGFWGGPDINASLMSSTGSYTGNCPGGPPAGWNGNTGHFWGDPSTGCNHVGMVVLSTGEAWGVYTSADVIVGALHGQVQVSGNSVTINNAQFFDIGNGARAVGYSGTVIPQKQLDITDITDTDSSGQYLVGPHFVGVYDVDYDQKASLAQLAGSYTGTGGTTLGGNPGTNYPISISNAGVVTLPPDSVGCSASGTATPHTDKNVFDLSLRFSGALCALGNGAQVTGIAVIANDGHLLMIGVTPGVGSRSNQFIYVGS
jgi:hypothetical protein